MGSTQKEIREFPRQLVKVESEADRLLILGTIPWTISSNPHNEIWIAPNRGILILRFAYDETGTKFVRVVYTQGIDFLSVKSFSFFLLFCESQRVKYVEWQCLVPRLQKIYRRKRFGIVETKTPTIFRRKV